MTPRARQPAPEPEAHADMVPSHVPPQSAQRADSVRARLARGLALWLFTGACVHAAQVALRAIGG